LFQRDVDKRVGCRGGGSDELKDHNFFRGVDWNQVYQQKYPPPLIPPRGEVNAADAFDIGSFDEEDTKGKKEAVNKIGNIGPILDIPDYLSIPEPKTLDAKI
jgi:hypothetical protein